MPNTQQPSFDREASLEELAGVGKKSRIDQRLADTHVTPVWYPEGEHDHVERILELLLD